MSPPENKDLNALLAVQVVDQELLALRKEKAALPESIRAQERVFAQFEDRLTGEKKRLDELTRERRRLEGDIDARIAAMKACEAKRFLVKKNEDYNALSKEIADHDHHKDLLEEKTLGVIEEIEKLEGALARLAEEGAAKRRELEAFRERVARELAAVEAKLGEAEARRAELVRTASPGLVGLYDKIRTGKPDGVAVAMVDRDACSGCHARVPPQKKNELMRNEKIVLCEACGRILVHDVGRDSVRDVA